jgi:hypothetical protein
MTKPSIDVKHRNLPVTIFELPSGLVFKEILTVIEEYARNRKITACFVKMDSQYDLYSVNAEGKASQIHEDIGQWFHVPDTVCNVTQIVRADSSASLVEQCEEAGCLPFKMYSKQFVKDLIEALS